MPTLAAEAIGSPVVGSAVGRLDGRVGWGRSVVEGPDAELVVSEEPRTGGTLVGFAGAVDLDVAREGRDSPDTRYVSRESYTATTTTTTTTSGTNAVSSKSCTLPETHDTDRYSVADGHVPRAPRPGYEHAYARRVMNVPPKPIR